MLRALMIAAVFAVTLGNGAFAQCRLALALGLDVSGSVDAREYDLQIKGLAHALQHPNVVRALLATPETPVDLAVFEWSAPEHQRLVLTWQSLRTTSDVLAIAEQIAQTRRIPAPPGTALGSAMRYGARLLGQRPECWRHTLDVSGDGKHNMGPHPKDVRDALAGQNITINALVIGADAPNSTDRRHVQIGELSSYFHAWVITGPDAFVETALGFEAYGQAMQRKLLREVQSLILTGLPKRPTP